jgi:acyl-CoA thioesterase
VISEGARPDETDPGLARVHAMLDEDAATKALGIELLALDMGRARMRMTVRPDMVQGHGTCHGGIVFSLADSAFAAACNGRGTGATFAASAEITWVAPAFLGDVLVADAVEHLRYGRNGITDVAVTRESDGAVIALFRGRSLEISRPLTPPSTEPSGDTTSGGQT